MNVYKIKRIYTFFGKKFFKFLYYEIVNLLVKKLKHVKIRMLQWHTRATLKIKNSDALKTGFCLLM